MKKIIVTGGLGFIGSNLIDLLIKKNFFVINIDKISYSSNFYNNKDYFSSKKYKFIALLQPTSPLRPKNIISNGIKILKKNKSFQNLIHLERTYHKVGSVSKKNEWEPLYDSTIRGQDVLNQFRPSGCLFLYLRKDFENFKKFIKRKNYGLVHKEKKETVNIDNEEDFIKLRFLLKNGNNLN